MERFFLSDIRGLGQCIDLIWFGSSGVVFVNLVAKKGKGNYLFSQGFGDSFKLHWVPSR